VHKPTQSPPFISTSRSLLHLIDKLAQTIDNHDGGEGYQDLTHELQSLRRALLSIEKAVKGYEDTPLHHSLAAAIHPQLEKCFASLKRVYDTVDAYRKSYASTVISRFWRRVWWSAQTEGELAALTTELSACRILLDIFLRALNSFVASPHLNPIPSLFFPS